MKYYIANANFVHIKDRTNHTGENDLSIPYINTNWIQDTQFDVLWSSSQFRNFLETFCL